MVVEVAVVDGDPSDVHSLESWLAEEPALRGLSVQFDSTGRHPEDMGPLSDVLRLVAEPGGILVTAMTVVGAWLATRSSGTKVRVRDGGREVEVTAGGAQNAEEIAKRILEGLTDR